MFYHGMQIIDLTENYRIDFVRNRNRTAYENAFPELFEHYYRFWTSQKLDIVDMPAREISIRKAWIQYHLETLAPVLRANKFDCDVFDVVLFIGVGTTNGHAFKLKDRFQVWLPLETYTSEKLVKTFVTHEIAHALHYHYSPLFYFESEVDKNILSRLLITEGMATYLTRELLAISDNEALWGDFLDKSEAQGWWAACQREEPRLFRIFYNDYCKSDANPGLFCANERDDIFKFRAGYYAGLKLIDQYAKDRHLNILELLEIQRGRLEKEILSMIKNRLQNAREGESVDPMDNRL